MDVTKRVRSVWKRLVTPGMWSRRRIVGEVALALVLALLPVASLTGGVMRISTAAAVVAALSLLRRAFPASVLVLAGALAGVLESAWVLSMVASWSAGARIEPRRRVVPVFVAALVLGLGLSLQQELPGRSAPETLLTNTVAFIVITIVPGLTSRYRAQRRALLSALHEHNSQLLREREMIASHARMRERQRIAQDMHDSLGHQLALITVHTGALEVDPELTDRQRGAVEVLRDASVAAMNELREAVGILRDGTEAQQGETDAEPASCGVAGINGLVEATRSAEAAVELRRSGDVRPLAPAADHAAYRIAQEALTNAMKHAPGASITVELRYEPDVLVVEVVNGPTPAMAIDRRQRAVSGGQGLTGLQERARLVGGMVHAGRVAGGGFRVAGVLPYLPQGPHASDGGRGRAGSGRTAATFVDAGGDFREQSGGALLGDGGAVIDWSSSPQRQKELDSIMGRKRTKGIAIGCGVALLIVVGLGAVAFMGLANWLEDEAGNGLIEPSVYDSVKVGAAETQLRDKLPDGDSILTEGLADKGPEKPKSAACLHLMSTEHADEQGRDRIFRFCFKDGKLVEKRSYKVKG
ncbi:sensor histidine kinase [Streptomyces coeruleorubidus]|uniref:sensor histidine kinase n=1 Tax=Streptomyces coeruleorubidus TaxID=116188 RepID=UPI0036F776EC